MHMVAMIKYMAGQGMTHFQVVMEMMNFTVVIMTIPCWEMEEDKLYGEVGNDVMDGGAGNDYISDVDGYNTYVVEQAMIR